MTNALTNKLLIILAGVTMLLALTFVYTPNVQAQEQIETTTEPAAEETEQTTEEAQPVEGTYDFVAQAGDSYSKMARKATQIYGFESQTNLSEAQIIFVETNLTQAAASPLLDLGQPVKIQKSTVSEWVEKAKNLTEEEKAAWEVYVSQVDFNTNNVGEVQQ